MKKKLFCGILAAFLSVCSFGACGGETRDKGEPIDADSVYELVQSQAHKEKAGYKFCGYFEDKAFTKRVERSFESVPSGYYAKYQPDRTQLFAAKQVGALAYEYTPMSVEQTIYATDYMDAIRRYLYYTYNEDRMNMAHVSSFAPILGEDYDEIEIRFGATEKNKTYSFHDETQMDLQHVTPDGFVQVVYSRDTKWKAYIGEAQATADGFQYYIVDGSFAVVVGYQTDTPKEKLSIPSKINGKPVKQVSIYEELADGVLHNVKELTVPSSVENAMLYFVNTAANAALEKITFKEGVRSIQLCSRQSEEVVIPSTAYYVDLRRPSFGTASPYELLTVGDQKITVNGGEHYFTEDGFLYSAEGDLVHQFANREKLNLTLGGPAKRVLRRSITGLAKNFHVGEEVEYLDLYHNEYCMRYNDVWRGTLADNASPVYFMNGEKALVSLFEQYEKGDYYRVLGDFRALYRYLLPQNGVSIIETLGEVSGLTFSEKEELLTWLSGFETKVEGNVVYAHPYDLEEGGFTDEWIVHSYLTEDFSKEDLTFDKTLDWYYQIKAQ